ncbi:phospholipid scramblase 4 [Camelus ferus]|nr:phospholipid scramblase 4 [Camelus ferus]
MDASANSHAKLSSRSRVLSPVITHFETNNRYDIKNNLGQMVYFVAEDTDDYTRNAYRTLRPFVLRVTDCLGQEIMTLQRPFRCTCCCFCCPSARQELEVQCPPGVTIGFVAEHWNLCRAVYSIQNEKKEDMMGVRGPCSTYGCGSDSVFEVKSLDGVSSIGSITRKWNGMLSTMSDADHFEIHFPLDLDVKMKAMIFGACFLIVIFSLPVPSLTGTDNLELPLFESKVRLSGKEVTSA